VKAHLWAKNLWWQILVPGLYFVLMYLFYPFRNVFWMDHDEGINLIKAQMVTKGFLLYKDIWNDQPPLFTYLLVGFFRLFGSRVNVGRVFVLLLACGLFFLILNYLRIVWGKWPALVGIALLILVPRFTDLSVSVMIGLPSIAFAMVSLVALVYWHKEHRYFWLIISALGLGASVMTKIFTGFLAPIFLLGILIDEYAMHRGFSNWRKIIIPGLIWGGLFTIITVLPTLLIVGLGNLNQLIENHLNGSQVDIFRNDPTLTLTYVLIEARWILLLAAIGIFNAVICKRWLILYPVAWMVTASVLLYRHVPIWDHQQLLITIPAVTLAAVAVGDAIGRMIELLRDKPRVRGMDFINLASLVVFAVFLLTRFPVTFSGFNTTPVFQGPSLREASTEVKILNIINQYAPETHWLVTDLPIYAFYTDLLVPPNLVVFSVKRVEMGILTEAEVLATIQELQPEQILFGRNIFPAVQHYVDDHYQVMHAREPLYLYLINELAPTNQGN